MPHTARVSAPLPPAPSHDLVRTAEDRPGASARTRHRPLARSGARGACARRHASGSRPLRAGGGPAAAGARCGGRLPDDGRPAPGPGVPPGAGAVRPRGTGAPVRSDRPLGASRDRACGRSPHGRTAVPEGR